MEAQLRTQQPVHNWRSAEASPNWRVKDNTPRTEAPGVETSRSKSFVSPRQPFFDQRKESRHVGGPALPRQLSHNQRKENSSSVTSREAAPSTRIYVGNLLYKAQSQDVEELFKANGFAAKIDMSTDPFTGRNPSYCFVDLETVELAQIAMKDLDGMELLGRPIKIKPGVSKKSEPIPGRISGAGNANEPPRRTTSAEYKPTFDRWSRSDAPAHWEGAPKLGTRVYVGGLPRIDGQYKVDAEMQALFAGFKITAVSKIISPHPSKPPGNHFYLFVDFTSSEEANGAIEALNDKPAPWGGKVIVNSAEGGGKKVIREQFEGKKRVWNENGEEVRANGLRLRPA